MNKNRALATTSNWANGKGILSFLTNNHDVPWKTEIQGQILDYDYYANRSGNKIVSPLVENFVGNDGTITDANMAILANIIFAKFSNDWISAYNAINAEYDPIQNYNMTEEESPAKTKETITPAETTETNTPAEYTETQTPAETTQETTLAEHTETETKQDKNINQPNAGIVSEDTKTFPTTRKTTTTELGQKTDVLDFNNRYDDLTKSGSRTNARDYGTGYIEEERTWGKEYTQERINAFNDGLVISSDTEKLEGVGNGNGGAEGEPGAYPGSANNNGRYNKQTGGYSDTESFTNYSETNTKNGSETHTIKTTGLNGSGNYTTEVEETGSEKTEHKEKDYSKWETERKYTQQNPETVKNTVDSNGQIKYEVDSAETRKIEVDSAETREFEALTKRKLTRSGNIGVTTSQQMIESEMELRKKYNFFNSIVYPAVDDVLTMNVFHCETKNFLY